jgi:hypothetical protein
MRVLLIPANTSQALTANHLSTPLGGKKYMSGRPASDRVIRIALTM